MTTPKAKTVVTMKLECSCPTHARTDVLVRDAELTIDEPVELGDDVDLEFTELDAVHAGHLVGDDVGAAGQGRHQRFRRRRPQVGAAAFDRRGVTLQEEIDKPFDDIQVLIEATTDADDASIEKVKTDLPRFCPVSKVLRQAGSKVTDVWTINRP